MDQIQLPMNIGGKEILFMECLTCNRLCPRDVFKPLYYNGNNMMLCERCYHQAEQELEDKEIDQLIKNIEQKQINHKS